MIYSENHPGKILLTELEVGKLVDDTELHGFLSRADLLRLLDQTNCVGIRIYYAAESAADTSRRLLAVGVRENGSEKDTRGGVGYILSRPFNSVLSHGIPVDNRDDARDMVTMAMNDGKHPAFASFFSKKMINQLLEPKNGLNVEGIGFYYSTIVANISTHVGASFVNPANLQRVQNNPAFSHIQSDLPCPGVCSVLAPGVLEASSTAETVASVTTSDNVLYLIKWNA